MYSHFAWFDPHVSQKHLTKSYMDVISKQLGAEAYCYVIIIAPMTCLIFNRLHKSLMVGSETAIQTKLTSKIHSFVE